MPPTWKRHSHSHYRQQTKHASSIGTGIPTLHKSSIKVNPFTYKKVETQSKQFTKVLKKAGKQAGVDITTGVSALFPRPHKVTHMPTSSKVNEHRIIFPQAELDKANKDTKHYPDNFQVHLCFEAVIHLPEQFDLSSDYSSEDSVTDFSDTDDEDP